MQGHQAADWYRERFDEAKQLEEAYAQLAQETGETRARVADQLGQARIDLAAAYLVSMDQPSLARTCTLTGFRGLEKRNPLMAMERERHVLQERIKTIEADEKYVRRQWLVGSAGELTRGRAEAWELFEPWQQDAVRFEDLEGFMDLLDSGYDTPEFDHRFWEPSYWRRWAAGDRICASLEMADFGDDVLPEYRRIAAERDKWKEEVAGWDRRIAEVHDLVKERDDAVARIPQLPEIYLAHSHSVLAAFLEHADLALLEQWSAKEEPPDRGVRMGLRRVAGLQAKLQFIDELLREGIQKAVRGFQERATKYARKSVKYERPKHRRRQLSSREIDSGFLAKKDKYHQRVDKMRRLVARIETYDSYERFELSNEPELWWVEMTRRQPGSVTPSLQRWYARNRERAPRHDDSMRLEEGIAEALAGAASMDDDLGYLS